MGTNLVLNRAMLRCFIVCSFAEWNCMLVLYFNNAAFRVQLCLQAVCFSSNDFSSNDLVAMT